MSSRASAFLRNVRPARVLLGYGALLVVLAATWATRSLNVGALAVLPLVYITLAMELRVSLVTATLTGIVIALIDTGAVPGGSYFSTPIAADAAFLAFSLAVVAYVINTLSRAAMRLESAQSRAVRDPLTGIHNREHFMDQLRNATNSLERGERIAVLFADLDRFKEVNDTGGHTVGDKVLALAAQRIQHSIRAQDSVSRIGGDEFAILIKHVKTSSEVDRVVGTIVSAFNDPFVVGTNVFSVGITIGTSFAPDQGTDADMLLAAADADMYQLKQQRRIVPVLRGSV